MPRDRKTYSVYIMSSLSGTLYIGMTNNLRKRVFEHRFHRVEGFTDKWSIERLVYHESFDEVARAINREKQLKGWRRSKKIALIEFLNPHWLDLAREWYPWMTPTPSQCHPERSNSVREAGGVAKSKDPYPNWECRQSRPSHTFSK